MSRLIVDTTNATYVVDRDENKWVRTSSDHRKPDDGEWTNGGFTIGDIGQSCFAHYANHPDGALGRHTSRVISVEEYEE